MKFAVVLLLFLECLDFQDPAALVEQLRADDITVRERAVAELEKLGAAAEGALKKVADDRDAYVVASARRLLRILELEKAFSPALKEAMPGLARRLALVGGPEWTTAYLTFTKPEVHPKLTREDLAPLAEEAIRGALTAETKQESCEAAVRWFHRSARAAIVGLLKDGDKEVRYRARRSLDELFGNDARAMIVSELESEPALYVEAFGYWDSEWGPRLKQLIAHHDPRVAGPAIAYLARARVREALPDVRAVLKSAPSAAKLQALEYFQRVKSKESFETVGPLLSDADPEVRNRAVRSLKVLEVKIDDSTWKRLLADSDPKVVGEALREMSSSNGRKLLPEIRRLARESNREVAWPALAALRRCGDPGYPDFLLEVIKGAVSDDHVIVVLHLLADCDPTLAVPQVRSVVEDSRRTSDVRRAALRSLRKLKASLSNEQLSALVRGDDAELAVDAALQFGAAAPGLIRSEISRLVEAAPSSVIRMNEWGVTDERHRFQEGTLDLLNLADPAALSRALIKVIRDSGSAGARAAHALAALRLVTAVPDLRSLLDPEDPHTTLPAILALAKLNAVEARPDFIKLLKSPEDEIRAAAATALGDVGLDSAVQELRLATRDPKEDVRLAAVESLSRHRVTEATPDLLRLLDETSDASDRAAQGLVELGSQDHLPRMLDWMSSGSSRKRDIAMEILAVWAPAEAAPVISRLLDHRDAELRRQGLWLAQVLDLKGLEKKLLESLGEPRLARSAAEAIVALNARELIPDLRDLVSAGDIPQRYFAVDALAGLEDAASAPGIRQLMEHPDRYLRQAAIIAAGRLRDREAAPHLIRILQGSDRDLQHHAAAALVEMGEPAPVEVLRSLLKDRLLMFWHPMWELIEQQRAVELVPDLRKMLQESGRDYAGPIARALGALGSKESIPDLMRLVEEGKEDDEAPMALAALQAKEALPVLRRAWEKGRDYRYSQIAEAMADLGDLSALENPRPGKPEEALYAARILCLRGDSRGVPEVLRTAEAQPWVATVLNAVRNPAGWKSLAGRPWRGDISGTKKHLVTRLAGLAGLKVQWTNGTSFQELTWPVKWAAAGKHSWETSTLLKAIVGEITGEGVLTCGSAEDGPSFSLILDSDTIRVLPSRDALHFWKQWWADEQAKIK